MKKRGKGRKNADYGIRDMYKKYVQFQENKGFEVLNYKTYAKVIKKCNKKILERILDSDNIKLPFLGYLSITKTRASYNPKYKNNWPVDWPKSKELGYKVYIEQEYYYGFEWYKYNAKFTNRRFYKFKSSRDAARAIKKARERGVDFYSDVR